MLSTILEENTEFNINYEKTPTIVHVTKYVPHYRAALVGSPLASNTSVTEELMLNINE
jgi:hypothetical protein